MMTADPAHREYDVFIESIPLDAESDIQLRIAPPHRDRATMTVVSRGEVVIVDLHRGQIDLLIDTLIMAQHALKNP